jgi:aldose 1-epimerase
MGVSVQAAGEFEGSRVDQFTLTSQSGVEVDILSWGVVVRDWRVPVGGGQRHVVLGFESFAPYPQHSPYFGAIAGRVANRIGNARFELDGRTYALDANWHGHLLHGGRKGLGRVVWSGEIDTPANAVRFSYHSPDGEMGFPGAVDFTVVYRLSGNRLRLEIEGVADRRTPINVVQHQYFNLGTGPDVLDHRVQIAASAYTEVDEQLIPTGAILPVEGTKWDFRSPRTLRDGNGNPVQYDGNLVLDSGRDPAEPAAIVTGPDGALTLKLWTDRPGVQLYDSVTTEVNAPGGVHFGHFCGLCLEDQDFPDAVNHRHFPSTIHGPDGPYRHVCEIEIA